MLYVQLFAVFLISLAATLIAVPPVRRFAVFKNWVDNPDGQRKLHRAPIACIGGVAIVTGILAGAVYFESVSNLVAVLVEIPWLAVAGAGLIFTMGLIDDIYCLNFRSKFLVQIIGAALLVGSGFELPVSSVLLPGAGADLKFVVDASITLLWVVGVINAVNLVDGLDGLAAGLALIGFASFALLFGIGGQLGLVVLALPVIGALCGFLFHNFNPANIFMGNSGSYLLGYLLAAYSIQQPMQADPLVGFAIILVILGLPVLDTAFSVVRRLFDGRSPFAPDAGHVHHRLVRRFSHRNSVIILYAVAAGLGVIGISLSTSTPTVAVSVLAAVLAGGVFSLRLLAADTSDAAGVSVTSGGTLAYPEGLRNGRQDAQNGRRRDRLTQRLRVLQGHSHS